MNKEKVKKQFGNAIRNIRQERKLSQEELAEISSLHRTYISEVERGDRNISLLNIVKLCNSLNISASDLFRVIESEEES